MEKTVFFDAGPLRLEGRLHQAAGTKAVVITHPHPLYGGDLDNPIVAVLAAAYQRGGYTTLRFNFRGVGASGGYFDDGQGEQEDVRAAAAFLMEHGKSVTDLAGYSFGTWINLRLAPPLTSVNRHLLVAPPVALLDFAGIPTPVAKLTVIVGEHDTFAPSTVLRELLGRWQPDARLNVLSEADHFYGNATGRLATMIETLLEPPPAC